jgi:hypothetical protein
MKKINFIHFNKIHRMFKKIRKILILVIKKIILGIINSLNKTIITKIKKYNHFRTKIFFGISRMLIKTITIFLKIKKKISSNSNHKKISKKTLKKIYHNHKKL